MDMGQYDEARRVAAAWRTEVPAEARVGASPIGLLEEQIALKHGRATPDAERRLRAASDSSPCLQCAWMSIARLYDEGGRSDSAIAIYERAVPYPGEPDRLWEDGFTLPRAYRRLGELYEQKGNRTKALQYYGLFVELWRNADPDLQPAVREVKQRMAQLAGEPR
jgi:tetratricopeptide (TPR) repeat protein